MVQNYIFDFGNVLTRFDIKELTAAAVKDETLLEEISEVVFDRLYWDRLDAGTISDEEVKEAIRSRLSPEKAELACLAFDGWIDNLPPIPGMPELVAELKSKGAKLYLLSNISESFAKGYSRVPWIKDVFDQFDGLVFSGLLGLTKPGKDIFEHLLDKFALPRENCLFIDDSRINIEGAAAVGIRGYLFDGDAEKLWEYLKIVH